MKTYAPNKRLSPLHASFIRSEIMLEMANADGFIDPLEAVKDIQKQETYCHYANSCIRVLRRMLQRGECPCSMKDAGLGD